MMGWAMPRFLTHSASWHFVLGDKSLCGIVGEPWERPKHLDRDVFAVLACKRCRELGRKRESAAEYAARVTGSE